MLLQTPAGTASVPAILRDHSDHRCSFNLLSGINRIASFPHTDVNCVVILRNRIIRVNSNYLAHIAASSPIIQFNLWCESKRVSLLMLKWKYMRLTLGTAAVIYVMGMQLLYADSCPWVHLYVVTLKHLLINPSRHNCVELSSFLYERSSIQFNYLCYFFLKNLLKITSDKKSYK